ncbi:diaminopimelate epimerase [Frigidibacter sp. ROC022]|uniref:diaminopimelate epimerase n=1 Tax=Frigidibacter sp. ROC022 TaxID=2971796 RepID=UPI003083878A
MKMHGLGNDFVVIDQRGGEAMVTPALARALGDRHRGVGFDQLAVIETTPEADARLTFYNSDGSTAAACGNATRCVARHLMAESGRPSLTLLTERGQLQAADAGDGLTSVNMGPPQLDWAAIPLARAMETLTLPIDGAPSAVGMGNPHCVFFVADAESVDLARDGAAMEHHPLFPQATNVEYVQVRGPGELRMRVWERGTGITLACGSGACAAAVAAHRRGLADAHVRIELDGGWLELDWRADGVWMTGPTAHVLTGVLTPEFLAAV